MAAILRGDHPPDSRLPPEDRLAELFKVSRLTVREAVQELRHKGVVRVEQGRGTFVNPAPRWSPLDPVLLMARAGSAEGTEDLAVKLTEARRLVEVGVSGLAAQRRTEQDLVELGRALDRMQEASDRDDVDGFTTADLEFHQAVMAAAGNPFITALWMYGKLGRPAPSWTGTLHRTTGIIAFLLTVPVALHCLVSIGFMTTDARVIAHGLLGCVFYGAFVAKILTLHSRRLPGWALPWVAGTLFTALVAVGLTSAGWYFATIGVPG